MTILRTSRLAAIAMLTLAACGGSDTSGEPVVAPVGDDAAAPVTTVMTSASDVSVATVAPATTVAPVATQPGPGQKPLVEIPDEVPTELVVTELVAGSGEPAAAGDTVTVHYVGVRSVDGVEFDNSYDRGTPFPVTLGTGSVIAGWDQGLIGATAGSRIQLDIPAELAYGDQARSDVIRAGEALTFVVDVVSVEKPTVITAPPMADPADCPATDGSEPKQQEFSEMQPFCIDVAKTYTAEVVTNFGAFTIELLPEKAPQTVNNFVTLARYRYFDDTECHRAIPQYIVQCGDPQADGYGGPGYVIPDELPLPGEYEVGQVAMANAGPDSGGSQFFIFTGEPATQLPPSYALFGKVTAGFDSTVAEIDAVANPENNGQPPLEEIKIESVTITES